MAYFNLFAVILKVSAASSLGLVSISPSYYIAAHSDDVVNFVCLLSSEVYLYSTLLGEVGDLLEDLERIHFDIPERGITFSINNSRTIFLGIEARIENNNTLIDCIAQTFNSPFENAVATFMVQGRLASPPNFTASPITKSRPNVQRFTWDPPFTLNITDEDPDITGYRVCLSTEICVTTENTWYDFPSLGVSFEFRVAAINAVGEGNSSHIIHQSCDIGRGMFVPRPSSRSTS